MGSRYCIPRKLQSGLGHHGAGEVVPLYQRVWRRYSNSTTIHVQHSLGRLHEEYVPTEDQGQTEGGDVQPVQLRGKPCQDKFRP